MKNILKISLNEEKEKIKFDTSLSCIELFFMLDGIFSFLQKQGYSSYEINSMLVGHLLNDEKFNNRINKNTYSFMPSNNPAFVDFGIDTFEKFKKKIGEDESFSSFVYDLLNKEILA